MKSKLRKVRSSISRWFMRLLQSGRILRMPLLGITALSTMTTALHGTFLQDYTLYIAISFVGVGFLFAWLYDILKVMNLQNRAVQDNAQNFAGATMTIKMKIRQAQLQALGKFLNDDSIDYEDYQEELEKVTNSTIEKYRNGIDMEEFNE